MSNLPMIPHWDVATYLGDGRNIESMRTSSTEPHRDWLTFAEPTIESMHSNVAQWFASHHRSLTVPSTAGFPVCRNPDVVRRSEPNASHLVIFNCKDYPWQAPQMHEQYGRHYVTSNVWDADDDHHFFDQDLVLKVLFDVNVLDRFTSLPEVNTNWPVSAEMLPATSVPTPARDRRSIDMLEARQQRDAIVRSRDFRSALQTLVDEEQFSNYDLSKAIGISPGMLVTWRARPLDKLRQVNEAGIRRLLFAWKYWLHVTEGDTLGRYLRHTPQGTSKSLLDLLTQGETSEDELASFIDQLARYASEDRLAAANRRRALGGLPDSAYKHHVFD
jgi:hypothetical protein